jgi:DNA repair protein RecO
MRNRNIKTKGIILGSKTVKETDKLLFIYTPSLGKIKAIAKGALKPSSKFTGTTETLNFCTFELYQHSSLPIITDIKLEKNYKLIRRNFKKITSALLVTHLAHNLLFENSSLPQIFDLIDKTLKEIEKKDHSFLLVLAFTVKLLDILGLLPNFKDNRNLPIKLPTKYRKLLNFLKENPFSKIVKIAPTKEETDRIKEILKGIIENETESKLNLPL